MARGKKGVLTIQQRVHLLVTKGLSATELRNAKEIAHRLGWSVRLVRSTIDRINEFEAYTPESKHVLTYDPSRGGGWKLAPVWADDKEVYVGWLMRHIETRITTAVRHVEVAAALVSDAVP